jgi:hypothetical protein
MCACGSYNKHRQRAGSGSSPQQWVHWGACPCPLVIEGKGRGKRKRLQRKERKKKRKKEEKKKRKTLNKTTYVHVAMDVWWRTCPCPSLGQKRKNK